MDIISRFCRPTEFDKAEFGKIWVNLQDESEVFIQLSTDDKPLWKPIGKFFEMTFSKFYQKPEFINACLELYLSGGERTIDTVLDSIK